LYVADGRRIRAISRERRIRSIVYEHVWRSSDCSTDRFAADLNLEWPTSLAVDMLSNRLYILDSDIVYQFDTQFNIARIVLGAPIGCTMVSHF
jgi:hypothetical protein